MGRWDGGSEKGAKRRKTTIFKLVFNPGQWNSRTVKMSVIFSGSVILTKPSRDQITPRQLIKLCPIAIIIRLKVKQRFILKIQCKLWVLHVTYSWTCSSMYWNLITFFASKWIDFDHLYMASAHANRVLKMYFVKTF